MVHIMPVARIRDSLQRRSVGVFLAVLSLAAPAYADSSIGAGYFVPTPDTKSLGIVASTGLTLPIVPIAPQATLAIPFGGKGRYALTGEARVGRPSAYIGLGAGIGRFNLSGSTGSIYDAFVGKQIAPFTILEARLYGGGSDRAGSSGFIGFRLSLK